MNKFSHVEAASVRAALKSLKESETLAIAGGTDLLTELKKRIRTPQRLVNLKSIPGMRYTRMGNGRLRIGALTTIAEIEKNPLVSEHASLLQQAAALVGSPQIRNMGTLGGNLGQQVRCGYYRHPDVRCWLKGGKSCFARKGINRYHALFGKGSCVAVNPSDLAPALMALDASVHLEGMEGKKTISLEALYRMPDTAHRRQTAIDDAELIIEISIPARSGSGVQGRYLKSMERAAWSFSLVSAAVRVDWEKNRVMRARVVLGGVAAMPWRAHAAEKRLIGRRLDNSLARRVGENAVSGARPLEWNAYKIPMVKNLVHRALLELKDPDH